MDPVTERNTLIADLGIIGDRRTAALIRCDGCIVWYCPRRFDHPSLFAALLDPEGGEWRVDLPGSEPSGRRYVANSGVLETRLRSAGGEWTVTDWMPTGNDAPAGLLCRSFGSPPADVRIVLRPRPNFGTESVTLSPSGAAVVISGRHVLHASHPLSIDRDEISMTLPQGEAGWSCLSDDLSLAPPSGGVLNGWLTATLEEWRVLSERASYSGPYEAEVKASLRAIRLLCHDETGGIVAAATTSLPEVVGGSRNWDYRFVWLRDAGMIVSALTRLGDSLSEGAAYLDFICRSRGSSAEYPVPIMTTLDGDAAPREEKIDLEGYLGSRPIRVGNNAGSQMQLDAFGNVLLAAKLIYQRCDERPHWDAVEAIADFLCEHWHEADHGIWEESAKCHYTSSKVLVACALNSAAEFSTDTSQAHRWRAVVGEIREFVSENCINSEGAFAAIAGGDEVDVSAALFPVWGYVAADAPEMAATIAALEREWSWQGLLYWRRLECADSRQEGAFLAGTFWVAQYWIERGDLDRGRRILDAGLAYANDLGLFAEGADPRNELMLGNFPQSFVHAAFIGAVVDLKGAAEG